MKHNVLYLHSHDTGRLLSPYGSGPAMPNLQRLADAGVLYRQAYCASPTCSPSRAALLTGQYPHQCGQWGLSNAGYPLQHPERHLASVLRQHGYTTAIMGVQHVAYDERDLAYDYVRPECIGGARGTEDPELTAERVSVAAEAWLREHAQDDRAWFLDVGMLETHNASWRQFAPHEVPTQHEESRAASPPWVPDLPESRYWRARFETAARRLDSGLGRVLNTLDELGLAENTLVVCTTDHGPSTPFAKCTLSDAGLGVHLILRGPGGFQGGHVIHEPVSHLDVLPTLGEVLGLEVEHELAGQVLPSRPGEADAERVLFAEINVHGLELPERCVRTPRYKLIRRYYDDPLQVKRNTDPQPLHDRLHVLGWPQRSHPGCDTLYDLMLDPWERHDVSAEPAYASIYINLQDHLEAWQAKTGDAVSPDGIDLPPRQDFTPHGQSHATKS
ncbi:MAG: sulfatase [Planctomycetota bacterium]